MTDWQDVYQGTTLIKGAGGAFYTYTTSHLRIDADGAPNAYHHDDALALDYGQNAGYRDRHGNVVDRWGGVLAADPRDDDKPYVQTSGAFKGFFVSMTALGDGTKQLIDPARWVDATKIPYLVFPDTFHEITGTGTKGDFVMAKNLANGRVSSAIVADIGPENAKLGEVSIALAAALGGANPNPKTGSGAPQGSIRYVVFPHSHTTPPWPHSAADIKTKAEAALRDAGGWAAVDKLY